jgi:hypothetical protein
MNLAAPRAGATPRPFALRWFDAKWIVLGRVALVVYLARVPLGFLVGTACARLKPQGRDAAQLLPAALRRFGRDGRRGREVAGAL